MGILLSLLETLEKPLFISSSSTIFLSLLFCEVQRVSDQDLLAARLSSMNWKHFSMTSSGLLLLCVPSNRTSILRPSKASQSFCAWWLGMRVSSSPWMKQILFLSLFLLSCSICFWMSISSICSPDRFSTLPLMQQNTQGKKICTMQQQALGRKVVEVSLQRLVKLEYAESDTIMSHSLLLSRLTAPILLPHPTTMQPNSLRQTAALSTSLLSVCPRVMYSASSRFPQPLKSKQAIPTLSGKECRKRQPSKRLEPFPCRQSRTQRISFCLQRVSSKPMLTVSAVNL